MTPPLFSPLDAEHAVPSQAGVVTDAALITQRFLRTSCVHFGLCAATDMDEVAA